MFFYPVNTLAAACPLPINKAYQYKGNATIFFITKNCTKQVFTGPTAFLEKFSSWKNLKLTNKAAINKISNDKNYLISAKKKNNTTPASTIPTDTNTTLLTTPAPRVNLTPPTPIVLPISSNVPKKFLTMVVVRDALLTNYNQVSWEQETKFSEDNNLQEFQVVIWNGGDWAGTKKISLYKFDQTFDPTRSEYMNGGSSWVNYRESFNILNIDIPAKLASTEYLSAFKQIMETIVRTQPAEHYGIKYLGHGTGGSGLFAYKINPEDSEQLLAYIKAIIGKKIDFLDWDTNCGNGTYQIAKGEYQYTDYILASDLNRGGYTFGQPDPGISSETYSAAMRFQSPEAILSEFFSPSKTIRQSLIELVNSQRSLWDLTLKNSMTAGKVKQSISIYDSSKFEDLTASTNLGQGLQSGDVLNYIKTSYPAQEHKFYDFRFHYVNNKDFFPWDESSNGFKKLPL